MANTEKLMICQNNTGEFCYLYHKIIGDGHCFINCYLDTLCKTYQQEKDIYKKAFIARKTRLDFANYLMSTSTKDPKEICAKLNILNPSTMSTFFKIEDSDESVLPLLVDIEETFKKEHFTFENIYWLILSLGLISKETSELATLEYIQKIYERDPRYNIAMDESRSDRCGLAKNNIANPSVMSTFFKYRDYPGSVYPLFEELVLMPPDENGGVENVYRKIMEFPILFNETNEPPTYENLKNLYERDPKYNIEKTEIREDQFFVDLERSGIDKFPINIRYYEISSTVSNTEELIKTIEVLCDSSEYLRHQESFKIASFFGINSIVFSMNRQNRYKEEFNLIEDNEGGPEIFLVNLNNVHWNMVTFKEGEKPEKKVLLNIDKQTKKCIFDSLQTLYNMERLEY